MKRVERVLFLGVVLVLLLPAVATAEALAGRWQGQSMVLELGADGQFRWQFSGQTLSGSWERVQQGVIGMRSDGGEVAYYGYSVANGAIGLQDANGGQIWMQRSGAPNPAATAPAIPADGALSEAEWLALVEGYPNLPPDEVGSALARLSADQSTLLQVYGALAADMFLRACQGRYAAQVTYGGGCGVLQQQRQQAMAWTQQFAGTGLGDAGSEARIQRMQVANAIRCSSGAIDAATCGAYVNAQQNVNQMQHETGKAIIENMGSSGCTRWYDQDNVYLGCW